MKLSSISVQNGGSEQIVEQLKKYFSNPDSLVSLFLGIAVVVVIGVLIANYVRNGGSAEISDKAAQEEASESATLPATHTVEAGETLWDIAEKTIGSGYNWVDIAKENNMANPDVVTEGTKLTIPKVEKKEPTAGSVSSESVEVKKPESGKYTVQTGDSLWNISVATYGTGYRWSEIATLNNLDNPNVIHAGNVLQLP